MVVDGATLDPGIAEVTPTILPNEDHISISKPQSKNTTLYKAVRTFIKRCLRNKQPLPNLKATDRTLQTKPIEVNTYIDKGNYNENIGGNYINVEGNLIQQSQDDSGINPKKKTLNNLPNHGASNFVGRETQLQELDKLLNNNQQVAITAIAGMGGIGKTELALQYALQSQDKYPGGVCWLKAREADIGTQIIELSDIQPPDEFDLVAKVQYCWRNWQDDRKLLIVLDDVLSFKKDYYQDKIDPYLPPPQEKFKVLLTSRQRPGTNIKTLDLEVLSPEAALELLTELAGESRINVELQLAKDLCEWLGYLPLGLELVGRYLDLHPTFTIAKTLERLEKQKLKAKALLDPEQADMTGQLGVAAAFDLSWSELSAEAQLLGCYLSLFSDEPFAWLWVEVVYCQAEDETEREMEIESLEELRDLELLNLHLLKLNGEDDNYQLHSLIAQYFRAKLEATKQAEEKKQAFCQLMIYIAQSIPQTPTLRNRSRVTLAIPHFSNVATELIDYVDDDNVIWSFMGLARFYKGQGAYNRAGQWCENNLQICRTRLGEQHPDVAASLNNLAYLYQSQGRYEDAEPLYIESLEMRKQLLGENHPDVANSLNNLAGLYQSQGRYEDAEPLYIESLEMSKQLLGENHPDVASSLNNLALLYQSQGRYEDAEPLYIESLEMRKQLLGETHPSVASSLNNLAGLYQSQGRYEDAESLYIEVLEIAETILGEKHPSVANSLHNLASLYNSQERYEDAEPLFIEALEIAETTLGENHPNTNTIRENFNYTVTMRLLQMPEAELKELVPPEVFEQLLQYKKQLDNNE
ncbi:tetratricopeptide repeat protein [Hyella patelloides]